MALRSAAHPLGFSLRQRQKMAISICWRCVVPEALILPLPLGAALRFIPEQFEVLHQDNPEAVLEPLVDGFLILMAPTGSETGAPQLVADSARAGGGGVGPLADPPRKPSPDPSGLRRPAAWMEALNFRDW
jgi:hypothetical protein